MPAARPASKGKGRTVTLHPKEALLQQARAFQKSEDFAEYRGRRQVVEHRLARLVQLGVRQSRYFGRAKTLFQLLLAATVANLTLVATKTGMMSQGPGSSPNKPENRPDRPAAGACPEFATGSPIVTAQFILVAASWAALSNKSPGLPEKWLRGLRRILVAGGRWFRASSGHLLVPGQLGPSNLATLAGPRQPLSAGASPGRQRWPT